MINMYEGICTRFMDLKANALQQKVNRGKWVSYNRKISYQKIPAGKVMY